VKKAWYPGAKIDQVRHHFLRLAAIINLINRQQSYASESRIGWPNREC
jgi:hypothetical protein